MQGYQQKNNKLSKQTKGKWIRQQKFIKTKIKQFDDFNYKIQDVRYIGGVDISFSGKWLNAACAALVIYDTIQSKTVYQDYQYVILKEQYIPGFLAFRQLPPTLNLFQKLKKSHPEYWPQLIMVDGNGIVHKFMCGYACHLGVILDTPTIGCAKTFFDIDGLHQSQVQEMLKNNLQYKNQNMKIKGKSGKQWCTAVLSDPNYNHYLYISVGTKICLQTATKISIKYLHEQTPHPVWLADRNSRKKIKKMNEQDYKSARSYEMIFFTK